MPQRAPEIEQLVRAWLDAKQAAAADAIEAGLGSYEGALAIGTDSDEWYSGPEAFREAHTAGGPFEASIEALEAHRAGLVAWAAVRATIETGEPGGFPIRLTLVLIEEGGDWRIVQSHAST
jgi:ketosteroid isomerase-like protein